MNYHMCTNFCGIQKTVDFVVIIRPMKINSHSKSGRTSCVIAACSVNIILLTHAFVSTTHFYFWLQQARFLCGDSTKPVV